MRRVRRMICHVRCVAIVCAIPIQYWHWFAYDELTNAARKLGAFIRLLKVKKLTVHFLFDLRAHSLCSSMFEGCFRHPRHLRYTKTDAFQRLCYSCLWQIANPKEATDGGGGANLDGATAASAVVVALR